MIAFILALLVIVSAYGQGWMGEMMVNTVTDGKQASRGTDTPWSLVADNGGRVHVVWEDRRDEQTLSIYYRGKSPSPTWDNWDSQDIDISRIDSINLIGHPSIGALDNGSLISVFAEERLLGGELLGASLPAGFPGWLPPQYISIPGGNSLSFNSTGWQTTIATNGHRAVTFWPYIGDGLDDYRPIFYRKFIDGVWQGDEIPLVIPEIGLHYYAKNLSATWARQDTIYLVFASMPENQSIYQIAFVKINFADDSISDFQIIASDSVISQEFPYICRQLDKYGRENIHIAYDSHGTNELAKYIYWSELTESWSSPLTLGDTLLSSGYPCLAVNVSGTIEFAFEQPGNEPHSQIYYQTYDSELKSLSNSVQISEGDYFSKRPVIACDIFGNTHITYISNKVHPQDPGNEEVFYRMYDAAPLGPGSVAITDDTIKWEYIDPPDLRYFQIFAVSNEDTFLVGATLNHYFRHNFGVNAILGVRAVDLNWQSSPLVIADINNFIDTRADGVPNYLELGTNYPNPFNSYTMIPIGGNHNDNSETNIKIFDIVGRVVRSITINPGDNKIIWDGTTQDGTRAVSGIYFYWLHTPDISNPGRKMILLR